MIEQGEVDYQEVLREIYTEIKGMKAC